MEENRYLQYINYDPDNEENRQRRKKKRVTARITAFISLFVILIGLGVGTFFLLRYMGIDFGGGDTPSSEVVSVENDITDEVQDSLQDLLENEDEIIVAPPEQYEVEPTEEELYEAWLEEKIAALTIEEKVLGLFIVRPEQITGVDQVIQAGEGTKAALETYPVGGLLYSEGNILSAEQFKTMLSNTREYSKFPIFLAVSEQSGKGTVASKLSLDKTMTAAEIGATMDPYSSYTECQKVAQYLKEVGIDLNLGLNADVLGNVDELKDMYYLKDSSFGTDPVIVSRMVYEGVRAYKETGVNIAIGNFPGEGDMIIDPGLAVSVNQDEKEVVNGKYQEMYTSALESGASAIIVSHAYADHLSTDNMPSSLSKDIYTTILREEYGFHDTILITDCLDEPSISEYYTSAEACVKALKAGADMVMCPDNFEEGYQAVLEAVKSNIISEERVNDALMRVWKVKYRSTYESVED